MNLFPSSLRYQKSNIKLATCYLYMKIFIIHGEHTLNSYERMQDYIKKAKEKGWEIQNIDVDNQNLQDAFLGQSLFTKNRLLILKEIKLLNANLLKWLSANEKKIDLSLVIYHRGIIPQKTIKALPKLEKVEEFKITKLIWSFLDSLFPGNAKMVYKLFHEVVKNEAVEFVFAMMARQIRDIYWAKVDPKTMEYPAWRVGKLKNLASKFSQEGLETLIDEMVQADINSKTSHTDLEKSLDFLIAKYLE